MMGTPKTACARRVLPTACPAGAEGGVLRSRSRQRAVAPFPLRLINNPEARSAAHRSGTKKSFCQAFVLSGSSDQSRSGSVRGAGTQTRGGM